VELLFRDGLLHGIVHSFEDASDGDDAGIDVNPRRVLHIWWLDKDAPGKGFAEDLHGFEGGGCGLGEEDGINVLEREGEGEVEGDHGEWGGEGGVDSWVGWAGGEAPCEGWAGGEGFGGVGRTGRGCGGCR